MENHNNSLLVPNVHVPRWIEAPTDSKVAEARVLLAEIACWKGRGLTAKVLVINFVLTNIQPLKDKVHPTYVYTRDIDPSLVTNK
jgi:uncharacterized membrane protein YqaE (UPF0057 family)